MVEQEPKDNRRCRKMFDGFKAGRANDFQRISNQSRALLKGSEDVVRTSRTFLSNSSSETQGQLVGTGKSLKRAKKKFGRRKVKNAKKSPCKLKTWIYLQLRLARPCVHLRWLALTLVEIKFARKSKQVFHHLATQPK